MKDILDSGQGHSSILHRSPAGFDFPGTQGCDNTTNMLGNCWVPWESAGLHVMIQSETKDLGILTVWRQLDLEPSPNRVRLLWGQQRTRREGSGSSWHSWADLLGWLGLHDTDEEIFSKANITAWQRELVHRVEVTDLETGDSPESSGWGRVVPAEVRGMAKEETGQMHGERDPIRGHRLWEGKESWARVHPGNRDLGLVAHNFGRPPDRGRERVSPEASGKRPAGQHLVGPGAGTR